MKVSRIPQGGNVLSNDSFTKTPKGKNVLPSENTNNHDHTHTKNTRYNEQWKINICRVGAYFSSRFCSPILVFDFLFLWRWWERVKNFYSFCSERKFRVPFFLCFEGEFFGLLQKVVKGSFGFPGREDFLTLVADQGRSFPLLFDHHLTGTWGLARVFFSFDIFS